MGRGHRPEWQSPRSRWRSSCRRARSTRASSRECENPLGIGALQPVLDILQYAIILLAVCMVAAAVSLVVRFRRAGATERLQIKWLAAAATLTAVLFLVDLVLSAALVSSSTNDEPTWLVVLDNIALFSVGLIPVAIAVAVLRHRLYEIDVIIRRTLVYAALTLSLVGLYLCTVAGTGALLRTLTGSSGTLAVTLSTLAVAGAFHPARGVIQRAVDRRFNRAGYDAQAAVDGFSEQLRNSIDLDALCRELRAVVAGTVEPEHASVWLRSPEARGERLPAAPARPARRRGAGPARPRPTGREPPQSHPARPAPPRARPVTPPPPTRRRRRRTRGSAARQRRRARRVAGAMAIAASPRSAAGGPIRQSMRSDRSRMTAHSSASSSQRAAICSSLAFACSSNATPMVSRARGNCSQASSSRPSAASPSARNASRIGVAICRSRNGATSANRPRLDSTYSVTPHAMRRNPGGLSPNRSRICRPSSSAASQSPSRNREMARVADEPIAWPPSAVTRETPSSDTSRASSYRPCSQ